MTKKDDARDKVDFSPPDAGTYRDRIAAAKQSHTPVGGADMPKMPALDQPPQQNRHQGVQNNATQGRKFMNPEEYNQALATGQAIPGVGGAFVANQPRGFVPPTAQPATPPMEMTSRDGTPVNPPRAEGGLRPETQAQLQAVAQANAAEGQAPAQDDVSGLPKEDEDLVSQLADKTTNILRNKERRLYIESQITDELSFEDLLFNQEIRQRVPINKKLVPTFRTPSAAEDLFIKRRIGSEEGSPQYILDRYACMGLVCGLFAINGKPLPDHLNADRMPDDKKFQEKYDLVMRYPLIIVADLSANFLWFEDRVQKLMSLDAIKSF